MRRLSFCSLLLATIAALPSLAEEQLRFVAIVTRHGVRAPTWTNERLNAYSAAPWPDFGVPPSHLTSHGREGMRIMGSYYHGQFQGLQLSPKSVYIWADTDQRTLESAKALAEGLVPGSKLEIHSASGDDRIFDPRDPKADAARAHAALIGRFDLGPLTESHRPALEKLDAILRGPSRKGKSIFDEPAALKAGGDGVSMTGPLRLASTFTENLLLEYTNGFRGDQLGWGRLDEAALLDVMRLHTVYANLLRRTRTQAAARGRNLLAAVTASLEQAAAGKRVAGALDPLGTSVLIISGHDTNVSNLAGLLDVSWVLPSYQPDDVPPGGALVFALWRDSATGQSSVRVRFVAQTMNQLRDLTEDALPASADLFVPACSSAASGYPCGLADFVKATRSY